jgi:hypothetical protein
VSNFNESGFQIRVVTGNRVYVSHNCEAIYNTDLENRELVIVVAIINYGGTKVLVIIIFKGVYYLWGHFKNQLNENILFVRSPTGFTNYWLRVYYIKYFNRFCPPSGPGRYYILIFDGYGSYISCEFLDYYWKHYI